MADLTTKTTSTQATRATSTQKSAPGLGAPKSAPGLTIARRFTRPGVSPYGEVECLLYICPLRYRPVQYPLGVRRERLPGLAAAPVPGDAVNGAGR